MAHGSKKSVNLLATATIHRLAKAQQFYFRSLGICQYEAIHINLGTPLNIIKDCFKKVLMKKRKVLRCRLFSKRRNILNIFRKIFAKIFIIPGGY